MDRHRELLEAAARVFAQHGFRGSTTRRIALEAGVNEVTIFRHFGSKDALLREAVASAAGGPPITELPATPINPERELAEWSESALTHLHAMRAMVCRCMSEVDERPEIGECANTGPIRAAGELRSYLQQLRMHGFVTQEFDEQAAAAMLMGALFADAMGRDVMPSIYPPSLRRSAELYAGLLLRALGVQQASTRQSSERHTPHTS